ncbi:hypothetical protein J2T57_001586 [Natronocella acetinitrilica]|uniref:Uncharacterized protein n=2 Tax=Natronocella acetinitrilica TaxID=414046 RepID=A0AAE3G2L1_9GAMM|nr:hypothetical protein [Natronocella acetinitrilica]
MAGGAMNVEQMMQYREQISAARQAGRVTASNHPYSLASGRSGPQAQVFTPQAAGSVLRAQVSRELAEREGAVAVSFVSCPLDCFRAPRRDQAATPAP